MEDFFITGGTLPLNATSYITRRADAEVLEGVRNGEFCYVLNTRQIGKSSLMVRAARQLKAEGCSVVVLDLTAVGQNLSVEQWYFGLLGRVGRQTRLEDELLDWWREHYDLGPMQRFMEAMRYVLLAVKDANVAPGRLVIFVDEIDVVRTLSFSADEFFAGIRECYNRRTYDPVFARLTFCLLGVATPSDLIHDTRISPFNIGRRIELRDFTLEEVEPLAVGFTHPKGLSLLHRVLHWTGGHPYLTQRLCRAVVEALAQQEPSRKDAIDELALVDSVCERIFLSKSAKETDDNLTFVRNRLLRSEADIASVLDLYLQVWAGRRVQDDETNALCSVLRLSGITTTQRGLLRSRCRIYARVFDRAWVLAQMPGAELRRQKRAYYRGLLRAASVFGSLTILAAAMLGVAIVNARHAHDAEGRAINQEARANTQAAEAQRLLYFSDLRLIQNEWENNNLSHVQNLLAETRSSPQRGWEWQFWNRLANHHPQTFAARGGPAIALFSPDNHLLLEGRLGKIYVHDLHSGAQKEYETVPSQGALPLDYAPKGSHLWAAEGDTVRDVLTGEIVLQQSPRLPQFTTVCALPDGKALLTGSQDGTLCLWNLLTRQCLWRRQAKEKLDFKYIAGSGAMAITIDRDGSQRLYRLRDGTEHHAFDGPLKMFASTAKAFSNNGTLLAGEGINGGLILLDLRTGRVTPALGGDHILYAVRFSPNDRTLIAAFWGAVRVWDLPIGRERNAFKVNWGQMGSYAISPDGRYAATGGSDSEAIWDLSAPPEPRVLYPSAKPMWHIRYSPDGTQIASGSEDGNLYRYEVASGRPLPTLRGAGTGVNVAAYSHNGQWIAGGFADGSVWVWNAHTGQKLAAFPAHEKKVEALSFRRDDRQLLTAGDDHIARVWNITAGRQGTPQESWTGAETLTLRGHHKEIEETAFSPDETRILTGSDDWSAKLWNAHTGALLGTFAMPCEIWSVAFSPDGKRAAFALLNNTTEVWDLARHQRRLVLQGHTHWTTQVAFSPDGKRIATASRDETARIWDAASGRELLTLKGHHYQVSGVAFSPDGDHIATSGADGTLRLWNAAPVSPDPHP